MSSSTDQNEGVDLVLVTFVAAVATAIIYTIMHRTVDDFIRYPSFIASIIGTVVLVVFCIEWVKSRRLKPPSGSTHTTFVTMPILVPTLSIVYYCIGVAVKDSYLYLHSPGSAKTVTVFLTAILTLGIGIALFVFRLKSRALYGLTEIIVGVTVAVFRVTTQSSDNLFFNSELYIAVLTAGIYLVVRGLDNIHQGFINEPSNSTIQVTAER